MGIGPKERRAIPDVDNLGLFLVEWIGPSEDVLAVLPLTLFLLLTVTLEGTYVLKEDSLRGEVRVGVLIGAGSLDRADCTRCSSLCI